MAEFYGLKRPTQPADDDDDGGHTAAAAAANPPRPRLPPPGHTKPPGRAPGLTAAVFAKWNDADRPLQRAIHYAEQNSRRHVFATEYASSSAKRARYYLVHDPKSFFEEMVALPPSQRVFEDIAQVQIGLPAVARCWCHAPPAQRTPHTAAALHCTGRQANKDVPGLGVQCGR